MTTYYVRSAGGNDGNAGTSFALGWATLQHAFDTAVAGDEVLICADGAHSPTATVDVDTNSGTASAPIFFKGASATGVDDGTQAEINGSGLPATTDMLNVTRSNLFFQNLRLTEATGHNISGTSAANYNYFKDCRFDNAGSFGCAYIGTDWFFVHCRADNNGAGGIGQPGTTTNDTQYSRYLFCNVHDNGTHGIVNSGVGQTYIGNNIYDNAEAGIYRYRQWENVLMLNNTIYGNDHGVEAAGSPFGNAPCGIFLGNAVSDNTLDGVLGFSATLAFAAPFVDKNLFNQNGTHRTNFPTDFTTGVADDTDPQFTDEGASSKNFQPVSASAMKAAGVAPARGD